MTAVGLVADDLTGACDSALPFLAGGPVRVCLWPHLPPGGLACGAVSTESREAGASTAYDRSRAAAGALDGGLVFGKLDSLLRGWPAADLAGVLDATRSRAIVAPALPGEGRTTAGGVQRWPGGEVDLRELLRPLAGRVDIRDAATDADLDRIAEEAVRRGDRVVAGTAGLAGATARALGLGPPPPARSPGCARPAAVVGSRAAAAQAAHARARGWDVRPFDAEAPIELDLAGCDGLVLTGGATAAAVLVAAGARGLDLLGEALPRTPLARVVGGRLDGLSVVLKAGAFGPEDAVHRALEVLRGAAA
jgi:uncharacterized protein YgbK (DUF1537 family)